MEAYIWNKTEEKNISKRNTQTQNGLNGGVTELQLSIIH